MKGILLALMLIAVPATATPFDWKPYAVLTIGQSMDAVTTLHQGPVACHETNRLLGPQPSVGRVLLPKLAIIGGVALLVRFTETRESTGARRLAKGVAYVAGVVGAKDGVHNLRTCGW